MINKNTLIISALILCYGAACFIAGKFSERYKQESVRDAKEAVIDAQEGYSKHLERLNNELAEKNDELENDIKQMHDYLEIAGKYGLQGNSDSYTPESISTLTSLISLASEDGAEDDLSPYIVSDESERTYLMDTEGVDYQDIHVYSTEIFAQENGDVIPDPIGWFGKENLDKFFDEVKKTGDSDMLIFSPIDATIYELLWDGVNTDDMHLNLTDR